MPKKTKSETKMKRQDTLPLEPEPIPKRIRTDSEESQEEKDERLKHFKEQKVVLQPSAAKLNPSGATIDVFVLNKFKKSENPKAPIAFKVLVLEDATIDMEPPKEKLAEGEELVPEEVEPEQTNIEKLTVQYVKNFHNVEMKAGETVRLFGVKGQLYNGKISFVFRDILELNEINQNDLDSDGKLHLQDPYAYENNQSVLCPIMGSDVYEDEVSRVPCGMVGEIDVDSIPISYVFENKQMQRSIALNSERGGFIIPVYQWKGKEIEKQRTIITRIYDGHLKSFGISDVKTWEQLAPIILPKAKGHLLGSVSTNDTQRLTCNKKDEEAQAMFIWTNAIKWDIKASIKACSEVIDEEALAEIYPDGNDFEGQGYYSLRDDVCNLSECNWTLKRLKKTKPDAKFYKVSNNGCEIVYAF